MSLVQSYNLVLNLRRFGIRTKSMRFTFLADKQILEALSCEMRNQTLQSYNCDLYRCMNFVPTEGI